MSPMLQQDKRISAETSISLEQQEELRELEACLDEVITELCYRRSHGRGLEWE